MSDQKDHDLSIVRKACGELMMHFDSVQVFVTRYEPSNDHGTVNVHCGRGNWFARFGQVQHWMDRQVQDEEGEEPEDFE